MKVIHPDREPVPGEVGYRRYRKDSAGRLLQDRSNLMPCPICLETVYADGKRYLDRSEVGTWTEHPHRPGMAWNNGVEKKKPYGRGNRPSTKSEEP